MRDSEARARIEQAKRALTMLLDEQWHARAALFPTGNGERIRTSSTWDGRFMSRLVSRGIVMTEIRGGWTSGGKKALFRTSAPQAIKALLDDDEAMAAAMWPGSVPSVDTIQEDATIIDEVTDDTDQPDEIAAATLKLAAALVDAVAAMRHEVDVLTTKVDECLTILRPLK